MPRPGSKPPMDGVPVVSSISELQVWLSRELDSKFHEQQVSLNRALEETLKPINLVYEDSILSQTNGAPADEEEGRRPEKEPNKSEADEKDLSGVHTAENGDGDDGKKGMQLAAEKLLPDVEQPSPQEVAPVSPTSSKLSRRQMKTMHMLHGSKDGHMSAGSRLRKFILGPLDFYMGLIVSVNVAFMCAGAQLQGFAAEESLGVREDVSSSLNAEKVLEQSEYAFFSIYLLDLVLRIVVLRFEWLYTPIEGIMYMNLFDCLLVILNAAEIVVLPAFGGNEDIEQSSGNVRILKLMRLTRALRIVRTIHVFQPLRVLITTTVASMGALFWSMVLLLMLQMTAALVVTQSLHGYIVDTSNDLDMRVWVNSRYGDFMKTMYTTFEITYSGGWPGYVRPVVERVSPWYALLFLAYVTFVVFAMIRIITALFIKETLACAARDAEIALEEKKKAGEATVSPSRRGGSRRGGSRRGGFPAKHWAPDEGDEDHGRPGRLRLVGEGVPRQAGRLLLSSRHRWQRHHLDCGIQQCFVQQNHPQLPQPAGFERERSGTLVRTAR
eukprot:TRINITY_DN10121_c0_g1_i2.p1 TRINITY_DN10121_c0_g1~~TRINITY_DN10121_c0_g1_i2.p1  ORF type:complete len:554 (-),score=65.44 TRINITY_DN10121_c0_g1_i2:370-2031(-)